MRSIWTIATVGLAGILGVGACYSPEPEKISEVADPPALPETSMTQVQQPAPFTPQRFTPKEQERVNEIQRLIVEALDDVDLAYGIKKVVIDGEVVRIRVPAQFGVSRMDIPMMHNGKMLNLAGKSQAHDPRLYVVSADGRPLTDENLAAAPSVNGAKEWDRVIAAVRENLALAVAGKDFEFETAHNYGWAKPIKLTKAECLPCHQGMAVGDVVAVASYVVPKGDRQTPSPQAAQRAKATQTFLPSPLRK